MSGHSKWAQIKRQKGTADVKRGLAFTKLANAITIAVRQGGGIADPESNFKLRLTIEKARAANMPKENIQRAIERGQGRGEGANLDDVVYEGFGPGGILVIVEAATDNKLRTSADVKNIFDRAGGRLTGVGSVSYQFQTIGQIAIEKGDKTLDDIFMSAADSGAEDIEEKDGQVLIYTKPDDLMRVKDGLQHAGFNILNFEIIRKPANIAMIKDQEVAEKISLFIEKLESLDEVQKVYTNHE